MATYRVQVSKSGIKGVSDFKVIRTFKPGAVGQIVETVRARVPKRGMTRAQVVTAKRKELMAIWEAKEVLGQ